jgi:hypothetical protein
LIDSLYFYYFSTGARTLRNRSRTALSTAMMMGILVGLCVLPGCSGQGEIPVSPSKGRRDEVQKAHEPSNAGANPADKKAGAH